MVMVQSEVDSHLTFLPEDVLSLLLFVVPFHLLKRRILGNCLKVFVQSDKNFVQWWVLLDGFGAHLTAVNGMGLVRLPSCAKRA